MNEYYKIEGQTLSDVADKVRTYTGATNQIKAKDLDTCVDDVYEVGKKAEYDAFWDAIQRKGQRPHYAYAFSYSGWDDIIFNPKYPITPLNSSGIMSMLNWNQYITDTKVPITAYGSASSAFYECKKLKRIPKIIFDGTTNLSNTFYNCIGLEEMYCEGVIDINGFDVHWSTQLNKESLLSILDVLADKTSDTSGTSWVCTLGAENLAKLSDSEKSVATEKGWSLA